jgi:two-component system nitrate/nitrite response regulator NarL
LTVRLLTAHSSTFIRDILRLSGVGRGVIVVGEARTAGELVELCRSEQPDVVYTEGSFDDGSEIESALVLLVATGARVIVVCDDPSPERLTRILELGASGYLRHDTSPEQVLDAVQSVAGGAAVLGPAATATVLDQWRHLRGPAAKAVFAATPATLTPRERDVLEAMAEGLPAKLIARHLGMAVKTVENHKIRIFDKLGVRTQAQAVSMAISQGMLANASSGMGGPVHIGAFARPEVS